MGKMAIKVAHFFISVLSGALVGYAFYQFRPNSSPYEAAGAGIVVALVAMLLLPKLHQSGGGGDF